MRPPYSCLARRIGSGGAGATGVARRVKPEPEPRWLSFGTDPIIAGIRQTRVHSWASVK